MSHKRRAGIIASLSRIANKFKDVQTVLSPVVYGITGLVVGISLAVIIFVPFGLFLQSR